MSEPAVAGRLHVVGVRHHSPACAHLVAQTLRALRPRHVLIEGPADMNPRLDEMALPHTLPIAIFTHHRDAQGRAHASFTPLCEYSPEWQALRVGHEIGARVRWIDLPAWHPAFAGVHNRYHDGARRTARAIGELCARLGVDGIDALWDHLFEDVLEPTALRTRLDAYFDALRADDAPGPRDAAREDFMRASVRAALAEGDGPVVVVCGGYHAPALRAVADEPTDRASAPWPRIDAPPEAASYLVPYSFERLDSFAGYEAGMPSPAYYQAVHEQGPARAAEAMLRVAVEALRAKKLHVSSADLAAALSMAQGLARLRGHAAILRTDLLDGLASALVKDALDAPLPWVERGPLAPGTDPLLAQLVTAFAGEREGRLAPRTPQPPLVRDAFSAMDAADVAPRERAREITLQLTEPAARARSRVLHRLRVLALPGFVRVHGPQWSTDPVVDERWEIRRDDGSTAALIEAARYGATLETAASERLGEALGEARFSLGKTAAILGESVFVGTESLTARALAHVTASASHATDLAELGAALIRVLGIYRHDALFDARGAPVFARAVEACHARSVWLLEHVRGASAPDGVITAVTAQRDALVHGADLALERGATVDCWTRAADAHDAPAALRGAALGALWSLGALEQAEGRARSVRTARAMASPATLGDFCAGLFALARQQVVGADELLAAIDTAMVDYTEHELLAALPALRLAFGFFPPREKGAIAARIGSLHGAGPLGARALTAPIDPTAVLRASALDDDVARVLAIHGLGSSPSGVSS